MFRGAKPSRCPHVANAPLRKSPPLSDAAIPTPVTRLRSTATNRPPADVFVYMWFAYGDDASAGGVGVLTYNNGTMTASSAANCMDRRFTLRLPDRPKGDHDDRPKWSIRPPWCAR